MDILKKDYTSISELFKWQKEKSNARKFTIGYDPITRASIELKEEDKRVIINGVGKDIRLRTFKSYGGKTRNIETAEREFSLFESQGECSLYELIDLALYMMREFSSIWEAETEQPFC